MTYEDVSCSTSEPWQKPSTSSKPFLHQETAQGTKQSTPNHLANSKDPATQNPSWKNKVEYHATTVHCRIFVQILLVQKMVEKIQLQIKLVNVFVISTWVLEYILQYDNLWYGNYLNTWNLGLMDIWALKHLHHWRHQPWRKGNHQLQAWAVVPKWRQHQRRSGTVQMFCTIFDGICFICWLNLWICGLLLLDSQWSPWS